MDRGEGGEMPPADPAADLHELARDWITLWQSELAALAVDREMQEAWRVLLSLWAGAAAASLAALPRGMPHEPARTRPADAPRAASPAAAPAAGDAEIERLRGRVAELERRLAGLERGDRAVGGSDPGRRPRSRRR
jgi:hypothetical protein